MKSPEFESSWTDIVPSPIRLPVILYKNRAKIDNCLKRFLVYAKQGKTQIIVTGRGGTGKSFLCERLRGLTSQLQWDPPKKSLQVESNVIPFADWSRITRVIPGQDSIERQNGLTEAFHSHKSLQGVIHVVDWGFSIEREELVRNLLVEQGVDTVLDVRKHNLRLELQEFRDTCERIKSSFSRCRRPIWLAIAVNKSDLFMKGLRKAQRYYSPFGGSSRFVDQLNKLRAEIGESNLLCDVLPISSWDADFEWNGEVVKSDVGGSDASRKLVANFVSGISRLVSQGDGK